MNESDFTTPNAESCRHCGGRYHYWYDPQCPGCGHIPEWARKLKKATVT